MSTSKSTGIALFSLLAGLWLYSLYGVTTDAHQGEVYRILYLHVPFAFSAFLSVFFLFIFSLLSLRSPLASFTNLAQACAEVGLFFTTMTLLTGSIWGKPTWGVWWTWDARLTTTFILFLLLTAYLLCSKSMADNPARSKVCAVIGIFLAIDVPIIYKSVTWWRTLHQPPSLLGSQGATMSKDILMHLVFCLLATLSCAFWLVWQKSINLRLEQQIKNETLHSL